MLHTTEQEERAYLHTVVQLLQDELHMLDDTVQAHSQEILEIKQYMWENASQLDPAERALQRIAAYDETILGEGTKKRRDQIKKLLPSPYFGRIDFQTDEEPAEQVVYIGIHGFSRQHQPIIYDWRAPISSLFYDYEQGPAQYTAPMGTIAGEILLKRQYKIEHNQLTYMITSSLNINDEMLQKELSQTSDEKMKNIVATIQREQNKIIRNEDVNLLVVQGAAGSGKTSIALHRVAFLLYRFKDQLKSENIMILSPNNVFADYIADVLPELGEENIPSIGMEELAQALLGKKIKFQTFPQQVEQLLMNKDDDAAQQITWKSTNEFVSQLDAFLQTAEMRYFMPRDVQIGLFSLTRDAIARRFAQLNNMPIKKRLQKIAADAIARDKSSERPLLDSAAAKLLKKEILSMFAFADTPSLYAHFYSYCKHKEYFTQRKKNYLDYADVFPYLYVKLFYEGVRNPYKEIKHLLVDEMQDYAPIQYAVLAKLFPCQYTILGDCNQMVNPYSASTADNITPYFPNCAYVELNRSYRSTLEIMRIAQHIQRNDKLIPMERHGEAPQLYRCATAEEELQTIRTFVQQFTQSDYQSLGILCKSQAQANQLYQTLRADYDHISLLDFDSTVFQEGIIITTIHMSKGLEFDQVLVPQISADNFSTRLERGLLYVACTRAMHKLDFTCVGECSIFLQDVFSH